MARVGRFGPKQGERGQPGRSQRHEAPERRAPVLRVAHALLESPPDATAGGQAPAAFESLADAVGARCACIFAFDEATHVARRHTTFTGCANPVVRHDGGDGDPLEVCACCRLAAGQARSAHVARRPTVDASSGSDSPDTPENGAAVAVAFSVPFLGPAEYAVTFLTADAGRLSQPYEATLAHLLCEQVTRSLVVGDPSPAVGSGRAPARTETTDRGSANDLTFQGLLDSFDVALLVTDPCGTVMFMNAEAEHLIGIPRTDMLDKKINTIGMTLHRPDGTDLPAESRPAHFAIAHGQPLLSATLVGDARGSWRHRG